MFLRNTYQSNPLVLKAIEKLVLPKRRQSRPLPPKVLRNLKPGQDFPKAPAKKRQNVEASGDENDANEAMDTSDPLDDLMDLDDDDVALEDLPDMEDVMDQIEAQFVLVEPDDEV